VADARRRVGAGRECAVPAQRGVEEQAHAPRRRGDRADKHEAVEDVPDAAPGHLPARYAARSGKFALGDLAGAEELVTTQGLGRLLRSRIELVNPN
jgi:hypothetical protein